MKNKENSQVLFLCERCSDFSKEVLTMGCLVPGNCDRCGKLVEPNSGEKYSFVRNLKDKIIYK